MKMLYFKLSYYTFRMDITTFVVKIKKFINSSKDFHSTIVVQSHFIFLIKTNALKPLSSSFMCSFDPSIKN